MPRKKPIKKKRLHMTHQQIIDLVSRYYSIPVADMQKKGRKGHIVLARHMAIYLCRKYTKVSVTEQGRFFNRDHTTIIASKDSMQDRIDTYDVTADYDHLSGIIEQFIKKGEIQAKRRIMFHGLRIVGIIIPVKQTA